MAIKERKGDLYIYFRPFKNNQIGLKVDAATKTEAKQLEAIFTRACRTGNYAGLDGAAREACVRMFQNQAWEIPLGLVGGISRPKEELDLWKPRAFSEYPEIRACSERPRYEMCFIYLAEHFG